MKELKEILAIEDDAERRSQLIVRGWELQRAESETEEQRQLCDWLIKLKSHPLYSAERRDA